MAAFLRKRKTGEVAVSAWRLHYAQLNVLFEEVDGFEAFMLVLANNTLRDTIYGTVFRVAFGAALSTIDAATDIYVITTYYESLDLIGQANTLLGMISANMFIQLLVVMAQYQKKTVAVKFQEALITLLFLRPTVDAYRVSTDHEDDGATLGSLVEMLINKVSAVSERVLKN